MSKIRIATDSTADIPKSFCEEWNITVLPLTILAEGKEYRDGVDIAPAEFYRILDESRELPVSSQVASALYTALFTETWQAGYSDLIQVTVNAKGSGTYQTAVMTRNLFYEEHPEAQEQLRIHILDSGTYSMTYGIPVIEGAKMIRDGADAEAVISHITESLRHCRPMFVPLNLRCVKKSGRISPAAAFVGDAIGLKPLITFEDGEAKIVSKARGESRAIEALLGICMREREPNTDYVLVYGSNHGAYTKFREACRKVMDRPPLAEYPVGCVISINTGPDMVGIIYRI